MCGNERARQRNAQNKSCRAEMSGDTCLEEEYVFYADRDRHKDVSNINEIADEVSHSFGFTNVTSGR